MSERKLLPTVTLEQYPQQECDKDGDGTDYISRLIRRNGDGKILSIHQQAFDSTKPNAFMNSARRMFYFADLTDGD